MSVYLVIAAFILTPAFIGITMIGTILVGYDVLGCYAGSSFWPGIEGAHEIYAKLKYQYTQTGILPVNDEELRALFPQQFDLMKNNSKFKYIYNKSDNTYTWFIRPSRYYVVVLDSKKDYQIFQLSDKYYFGAKTNLYPPDYEGPWDQLPQ